VIEKFYDFIFVTLVLSINMFAIAFDTWLFSHPQILRRFKQLPSFIQKQAVIFVVVPLFVSPLLPQLRFDISPVIVISLGCVLSVAGGALIGGAFTKIGVIPSVRLQSNLLTTGVYGLVRHPIYSGTLLAFLGLSLAFQALVSLLYWPLAVLLYLIMIVTEERVLVTEYGAEYVSYQAKVKARLLPFIL
jgi:protein-S-isoprenylcysteine O-methyltransferase Ste14